MKNRNIQILDRAIELTKTMGWTTEYLARDADGVPTDAFEDDACQFCAMGFLQRAAFEVTGDQFYGAYQIHKAVYKVLSSDKAISTYNDEIAESIDDITFLFKMAKEYVES